MRVKQVVMKQPIEGKAPIRMNERFISFAVYTGVIERNVSLKQKGLNVVIDTKTDENSVTVTKISRGELRIIYFEPID